MKGHNKNGLKYIVYEFNGMVLLAQLYYGEVVASLPASAFRYSHSDLKGEVVVERIRFRLDDREVCISSFSNGYRIHLDERNPETRAIISETSISYHAIGLPQALLDLLAAEAEKEKKEDSVKGVLRERIHHYFETMNTEECPCFASLEAYVSLMELREVADRCGYGDLVGLVDRYRVTELGDMV